MKFEEIKKQVYGYNKIENFKEQLEFLKDNNLFIVCLDNDSYYISIIYNEDDYNEKELELLENLSINFNIDSDFGNRDGVFDLFEAIGIKCDGV